MDIEINDAEINVEKIMEQVREKVKNKKELGLYNDEETKMISEMKLRPAHNHDQNVDNYLTFLNQKWDAKGLEPITSHRRILGPFIVFFKKLLRKTLQPFTNAMLLRQTEFNSQLVKLLNRIVPEYEKLVNKHDELANRQGIVESLIGQWHDELLRRHSELVNDFATLFKKVDNWNDERLNKHIDLVNDFTSLFKKVDNWHDKLMSNYNSLNIEYERLKQRHVELFEKAMEVRQENILQKHRLDRMLAKMRAKYDLPGEEAAPLIHEKENLMDHNYFLFENRHRGSQEEIKKRQKTYLPVFKHADNVLDIGCGRGEFLELLQKEGIKTTGIDLNEDMVFICKEKNLNVKQKDAIAYLNSLKDESLGGIFASHIIEHLNIDLLGDFVKLCYTKIKKEACVVFETPNPKSIIVSAINFYLDLSHVKHIHPEAIKFLLESNGFVDIKLQYLSPFSDEERLQPIKKYSQPEAASTNLPVELLNKNTEKLNKLLYGYQDYAVIAKK